MRSIIFPGYFSVDSSASVFPEHYVAYRLNDLYDCLQEQIYLLMRVMRMLVSMIVMLVYCVAVREEARAFLLTFIANYLIYLIYDSWFFFTFEANRKLKKKSNNEKIA